MKTKNNIKANKKNLGLIFLGIMLITYIIAWFINPGIIIKSLDYLKSISKEICFVLVMVFLLMFCINYFVSQKTLIKLFGEGTGIKGWLIAIISGIISMGPIYMWYPLLQKLKQKGVKTRYIAAFLYNRAIKLALLPLLIMYFGWVFVIVLTFTMILASIVQGIIIERMTEVKK